MFLNHFALYEQPFGVTPDPAYLYLSRTHRLALDALSGGIRNDRGFLAVIAEPGMGKTTLLYQLLDQLRDNARTIFMFQTQCDSREFFGHLLMELGMDPSGMDIVTMHERLNKMLFSEMLAGKRVVLIVDEAQNLAEPVLETVRLLSNFETPHAKLLQIVFAGQPQLATSLSSPALAQLRQRITVVAHLSPFRVDETAAYIRHRLKVAGYHGDGIFTEEAIAAIAEHSNGIPRRTINNLCFNAMSIGFDRGCSLLDSAIVSEATAQLCLEPIIARVPTSQLTFCLPPANEPEPSSATGNLNVLSAYLSAPVGRANISKSWVWGTVALAILILTGVFGISRSIGKHALAVTPTAEARVQAPAQQAIEPTLNSVSDATPQAINSLQFLLVSAQPNDTIKEISLRYLGKFDDEILSQFKTLNPEMKSFDQMTRGQLLRVPFPSGSLKKVFDSDSTEPSVEDRTSEPVTGSNRLSPASQTDSAAKNLSDPQSDGAIRQPPVTKTVQTLSQNASAKPPTKQPDTSALNVPNLISPSRSVETNAVPSGEGLVAALSPSVDNHLSPPVAVGSTLTVASPARETKIEPAELISRRDPIYPAIAKSSRISGSVEMHFKIGADGKVFDATVVKGSPILAQAALQALHEWRYKPAHLNGNPIESEASTIIDFKGN